jgi:predicted nuclease of predicted toxin-antitoxin system
MEKFYVNENFPLPVVEFLREFGHDVLTSLEAGNANKRIPDDAVLAFAIAQNRVLITINRKDFIKLHRLNPIHFGIIACTENNDFQEFANLIHVEIVKNQGQFDNQLVRVYKPA